MNTSDSFTGALKTESNYFIVCIWLGLHSRANDLASLPSYLNTPKHKKTIDGTDFLNLRELEKISADQWHTLCTAAGMTVYGSVALSWCKDAELSQVWEGWEASGFPLKPLPEFERPARFINPALLPTTNSLLELARLAENKPLPICAMIVAKGDALDVDLTASQASKASPQIAAFLKAHMERQANHTQEQTQMIETWTQIVSGTEWEM